MLVEMSLVRISIVARDLTLMGSVPTALVKQLDDPATWHKSSDFFQKEYSTDAYIAKMKKPIVSIMHGNTRAYRNSPRPLSLILCFAVGGGVGLSVHAPFRIATESTKIAMPEVSLSRWFCSTEIDESNRQRLDSSPTSEPPSSSLDSTDNSESISG